MQLSFRFLGSLKVAVPLLIAIAGVLAWGTIYETRFGTASVQRFIYQALWFQAILCFLAINLAAAAFSRWPWKRKHLPFLLAHLGIILMLVGGILGGRLGIEGQLMIPEGQSNDTLQLPYNVLSVHQPNPGVHFEVKTHFEATAWNHEPGQVYRLPAEGGPIELTVAKYYPNAERQENLREDGLSDNPALHLELIHEEHRDDIWLLSREPERFAARWGQAHVLFLEGDEPSPKDRGWVEIHFPELNLRRKISVPQTMNRPMAVAGTPYQVTFKDYFSDFALTPNGPVNRSSQPHNPAVALTLSGPEGTDVHLLFALHPEFAQIHGRKQKISAHASYQHSLHGNLPPDGVTVLAQGPKLSAVLTDPKGQRTRIDSLEVGKTYRHPSLGYELKLLNYYPKARVEESYVNKDNEVRSEVLHVMAEQGSRQTESWIPLRDSIRLPLGEHPAIVEYRPAEKKLPFSVKLIDFRKIDYPGTQMAAGFESDVELTDEELGMTFKRKISMNNPLKHRGFSLFQSSYVPGPPEMTILSVRKDPGTPLVYGGFLIILAGVTGLFTSRSRRAGTAS